MRKNRKQTVGFIGLGRMGAAFSKNLIADGFRVAGTDPLDAARARLRRMGGEPLATPREVAEAADVLFLSLPNSKISLKTARGRDGFLAFAKGKAPEIVLDTTTADPGDTKRIAAMCKAKKIPFLDACVSGHSQNVADRVGLFVIGGSKTHYKKITPLLERLLSDHIHCGGAASGATVKILINYLACLQRCALAETFRMGLRAGVKGDLLIDALKRSAADSRQLRNRGANMIHRRYGNPVSTLDVLLKDIGLGKKLAQKVGALTPLGAASLPIFQEAHRSGYGERDSAVVYQVFEDREKKKRRARR